MLLRPGAPLGTAPELWQEGDQMFDAVETLCAVGDDSWAKAPHSNEATLTPKRGTLAGGMRS